VPGEQGASLEYSKSAKQYCIFAIHTHVYVYMYIYIYIIILYMHVYHTCIYTHIHAYAMCICIYRCERELIQQLVLPRKKAERKLSAEIKNDYQKVCFIGCWYKNSTWCNLHVFCNAL